VPIHHGQRNGSGDGRTKADIHRGDLDMPSTPLFPFGHGLSYTMFEYPLTLASNSVDVCGELYRSRSGTPASGAVPKSLPHRSRRSLADGA
jgi:beta-xylosidase